MDDEYLERVAEHWKSVSSLRRIKVYIYICESVPPKQFLEEDEDLDVARATIQEYINDFKDLGLIEKKGRNYRVTEKGERFRELVEETESFLKEQDRKELEEFEERAEELRSRLDQEEDK